MSKCPHPSVTKPENRIQLGLYKCDVCNEKIYDRMLNRIEKGWFVFWALLCSIVSAAFASVAIIWAFAISSPHIADSSRPFDMGMMWLAILFLMGGLSWVFGQAAFSCWTASKKRRRNGEVF